MKKKTSSVDWLVKEISDILGIIKTTPMQDLLLADAMKQAKEMHREEIEEAHISGQCSWTSGDETANEYYNETYGSTKQN